MFRYRNGREQLAIFAIGVLFVLGAGYIGTMRLRRAGPISLATVPYAEAGKPAVLKSTAPMTSAPAEVVVDVGGAVSHPGVQRLKAGARVVDAVHAAGGPSPVADLDGINLAERVEDGEKIRVPRRDEKPTRPSVERARPLGRVAANMPPTLAGKLGGAESTTSESPATWTPAGSDPAPPEESSSTAKSTRGSKKHPSAPIDLNIATVEELQTLPGVGPATADQIVQFRATHGRITSIEELRAIRGLGERKLAKIAPYVKI